MLDPLYAVIGFVLSAVYSVVPNLGVAIIAMTCAVMAALLPLTAKQTRSMIAMQRIQPEIKKIQQQYKDDRQKQNEEILKFYQENKINPMAGCLPLLIQMPVLFALFGVLRNIQDHVPRTGALKDLYLDLCGGANVPPGDCSPKGQFFLAMDLTSQTGSPDAASGFVERLPYFFALALVMLLGWYQFWQTQRRQARLNPQSQNNPMARQMRVMGYFFPLITGWFSYIASAGIVVYFITSSLWRIGQQHLVLNRIYEQAHADDAAKTGKGGLPKTTQPKASPGAGTGGKAPPAGAGNERRPPARTGPSPHTARKKKKRRR